MDKHIKGSIRFLKYFEQPWVLTFKGTIYSHLCHLLRYLYHTDWYCNDDKYVIFLCAVLQPVMIFNQRWLLKKGQFSSDLYFGNRRADCSEKESSLDEKHCGKASVTIVTQQESSARLFSLNLNTEWDPSSSQLQRRMLENQRQLSLISFWGLIKFFGI